MVAIAISFALHEVFAALVPAQLAHTKASREVVTHAQLLRVTRRPAATPPPVRPVVRPAPLHARARRALPRGQINRARPKAISLAHARPISSAALAAPSGAGLATRAGSGRGVNGSASTTENGGPAAGAEPCGVVTFSDPHGSQFDQRTRGFWVDIRMSVRFADGSSQSMILDYPWYYPTEAANPWSDQNLKDPNFLPRFQSPPPDKAGSEPALVKYVAEHSTSDGLTLLRECPTPAPPV